MMKKRNGILPGLIAVCLVCVISATSCSESPQPQLGFSAGRINTGSGRAGGIVALVSGLISIVISMVHLGNSTGGFGTGSGRAGAIIALVLGLIGMTLGGLALTRYRRSRNTD